MHPAVRSPAMMRRNSCVLHAVFSAFQCRRGSICPLSLKKSPRPPKRRAETTGCLKLRAPHRGITFRAGNVRFSGEYAVRGRCHTGPALSPRGGRGDPGSGRWPLFRPGRGTYGLCVRLLNHRHDAEDVTQEVFLRVFRSLNRWDAVRPLKPWVMGIAVNRCRTWLSQRSRRGRSHGGLPSRHSFRSCRGRLHRTGARDS